MVAQMTNKDKTDNERGLSPSAPASTPPQGEGGGLIADREYGGERPLYKARGLRLERVTIHAGESSIKEAEDIEAEDCRFEGKYLLWETRGFRLRHCLLTQGARSSMWYSQGACLEDCRIEAPKLFRRTKGICLTDCHFTDAQETLWDCQGLTMSRCLTENADYLGMHASDATIDHWRQEGNYAFQYGERIVIRDSVLNSKDALWDSKDVTVVDSTIDGEYLGWYSRRLTLVRCHIGGTQPLCYCQDLTLEDCTLAPDADLCFEYSTLRATIKGDVVSVKNPTSGFIRVEGSIGELVMDGNRKPPADCLVEQLGRKP